jgi:hypothetical protein
MIKMMKKRSRKVNTVEGQKEGEIEELVVVDSGDQRECRGVGLTGMEDSKYYE